MKTYNNVYFTISEPIDAILSAITASLADGWSRDEDGDRRIKRIADRDSASHCFRCDKRDGRWAATVILTRTGAQEYWLSHVLPLDDSPNPFKPDQFNAIADEFHTRFLRPLEEKGAIFILNFAGTIDLEVDLGSELYRKLSTFSAAANKSTGSCHPCDRERWFEFIVSFSRADVDLPTPTLQRWLIEEEKWSAKAADELALEFEFGVGLLKHEKRS